MSDLIANTPDPSPAEPAARIGVRAALGGVLMGLANLVPGVSGGTMLLAAGVYEAFVSAIAELSTLRIRLRPVVVLATIAGSALVAIVLLAGPTKELVVHQRWIMYSLFIGLTLGGVPIVWRMAQPVGASVAAGAAIGLAVMLAMAFSQGAGDGGGGSSTGRLVVAGIAGASAMVLPGISGGYLLLLLGEYVPILSAIDQLKQALTVGGGPDVALLKSALTVLVPVGIGIAVGVVGVSNLVRWLLEHFRQPTLGLLLGLLVGAVVGLWPFQEGVAPEPGAVVKGRSLSAADITELEPEDWPVVRFQPSTGQIGGSLVLVGLGLLSTRLIDRVGGGKRVKA